MCGIAGIVCLSDRGVTPSLRRLARMAGALDHRGPDEVGLYRDRRAGLAHARLAIIDLAGGQQPLCNEDGTLWVSFNGEIFNYLELRCELAELGHRFRTRSDTEVIVHAWEEWGEGAFARFNGQYAIALWDVARQRLVLARDPVGILPLYVAAHGGRIYFASEVKALFAGEPDLPRELDPHGLCQSFTFWSVIPPASVFKGIEELAPGTLRVYQAGGSRDVVHWAPRFPTSPDEGFRGSLDEATEAVAHELAEATRLRMLRADVPVGSYLSGGLDSSLVASLGLQAKGEGFSTFSLRFEDAEFDETGYQRLMVQRLGSEHHEVTVGRRDIAEAFPRVVAHAERPILRTAPAPLYLLSRLVQGAGIKVVLTGEGADEVFAGYDLFREGKVRRFWARQPGSTTRPLLLQRLYPYLARSPVSQQAMARRFFGRDLDRASEPGFAHGPRWHATASVRRLVRRELLREMEARDVTGELLASLPQELRHWTPLAQDQHIEIRSLLSSYLLSSQGDRMLMAHSVEGRFPFLDPRVMELGNSLPDAYKLRVLDEKHVLKRLGRRLLPPEIVARKKQPYRAPDAGAFVDRAGEPASEWIAEVLSERALADAGVFEPGPTLALWHKCRRNSAGVFSNADNMALTAVLSTQLLHQLFVREGHRFGRTPRVATLIDCL